MAEIATYEEARKWIKEHLTNETFETIASLKKRKTHLLENIQKEKQLLKFTCFNLHVVSVSVGV